MSAGDHFAKAGANDRIWNAQEKLCLRAPAVFARYFANPLSSVRRSVAWSVLPDDVAGQCRAPRRRRATGTSRLSPRLSDCREGGVIRRMSMRCRPFSRCKARSRIATCRLKAVRRSFCRSRSDMPRISRVASRGLPRILRSALRPIAARKRRRAVLQSRAVSCGRREPHARRAAHGEPPADFVGLWPCDGIARSREDVRGGLSGPARVQATGRMSDAELTQSSHRARKVIRFRRISTGTHRSVGLRRRASRRFFARQSMRFGLSMRSARRWRGTRGVGARRGGIC